MEDSRLRPSSLHESRGAGAKGVTPAGRRPQVCPSWMTKEDFEVCRNDPYRAFDAAQTKIAELQQRVSVSKKLNQALLQDPQYKFGQAVQNFEKLKQEHIQLNDAYNDQEAVNESLQEVVEVLRGDKHSLLTEHNAIKREITIQRIENDHLLHKARRQTAYNESLDLKLQSQEAQLTHLDDDVKGTSKQIVELNSEVSALESTCQNLSTQSTSLSDLRQHLDTTRVAQDRAIEALEREVQGKAEEIVQHDAQLWEFKREMSGRILALQKKAQECNDELARLHRLSEHEINTLAAQNRALNDELKSTADALFATRREKTEFATSAKREIHIRKEEVQQCLSVLDLVERQNEGLEASIVRMLEQNKLSERQISEKDNVNNKNLIEQSNFISMIHMELQSTREDLYLLKARLCHHCRDTILPEEAQNAQMVVGGGPQAIQVASPLQQQTAPPTAAAAASIPQSIQQAVSAANNMQLQPMEFDMQGKPIVASGQGEGGGSDLEKQRMETELRRAREALDNLNRQLLEERAMRERERREEEEMRQQQEEDRIARQIEEDATKRRTKEDDRKLAAGEEAHSFTIRFVDGTRKKIDAFPSDTVGEIVGRICSKIGVRQVEFFHLAQSVNENSVLGAVDRFLDKSRTLEQENITPKCNLVLKIKHYKRHRRWNDIVAQEWFFKQIHQCVVDEYYPTQEKLSVELASYEIQSVYGDYSGKKRHSYFERVGLDSYLPMSVSGHEFEYWQERLFRLHKKRKNLSTIEARQRYIDLFATSSPYWGMTFFHIRDKDTRPFLAGIAEDGLYILSKTKLEILSVLRFDQLLNWEKSDTGIFIKKRGSSKSTLFGSTKLQSKEMVELLNEYYLMLPQDTRDRLPIAIDQQEELRSRLPPWEMFEHPIINRLKPVEFYSRVECFKHNYMQHCLDQQREGNRQMPLTKLTQLLDTTLDNDETLMDLDLSDCDPPLDDQHWAVTKQILQYVLDQYTPQDMEQWRENIDIKKLSLAHDIDHQRLSETCIPNVCQFIRRFTHLTSIDLSNIPIERSETDLTNALVSLPDLEVLVLKGCKIDPKAFAALLKVFRVVPSKLRILDVENNLLTQNSVSSLCHEMEGDNCSLSHLNIGFNRIEIAGLETLIGALKVKRRLVSLDFSGNPGSSASKFGDLIAAGVGLKELNISSCRVTGDEGVRISVEMKGKEELRKLNMSANPIGPKLTRQRQVGGGEITRDYPAEFFSFLDVGTYCNLNELILDDCQLHEDAGGALASVLHNNTKLTTLVVSNNQLASKSGLLAPAWTEVLPINQYLTKLHLSYNGITYAGLMKLFGAMMRNRSITELKLDGNILDRYPPNATHAELLTFLENNATVETLHMSDMFMKDDVVARIGEGLRRNRGLRKLVACNNEITVRGVGELAHHLGDNVTLEFLDLSCRSVQISDDLYLQAYKTLIDSSNIETVLL